MQRTFVMVKPDGVQRGLIGEVIRRFEQRGLKVVGLKLMQVSEGLAHQHYEAHVDKPFFPSLSAFITSGPVAAMVLEGPNAIETARTTIGGTRPNEAAPGTLRADFAIDISCNVVHGSDSPEAAEREIALWFEADELLTYERAIDRWLVQ